MSTLHQYIAVIGCFQGCLLFGLLTTDPRVSGASKILGLLCLLMGLSFLLPFLTFSTEQNVFSWVAAWLFFFPLAYGPLLFLYCRNSILGLPLRGRDLVHLLPMLFCYLLNIDTLIFNSDEVRVWVVGAEAPTFRIWLSEYILFAVAFIYAAANFALIRRFQRRADDTLSSFNPAIFRWLWTMVVSINMVWFAKGIMALTSIATPLMIVLSDAFIVIFIYLVAMAQWRNSNLFTIDKLSENQITPEPDAVSAGALDAETRATLFESVKEQIEEQALYRNSELTLAGLAELTGLGTHHLSEVLNQHAGKNFNQFVNDYRVVDVCERLKSGASGSILDLAMEAGFSSKSTFNTIFKKLTGFTPTQYKKSLP